MRLVTYEADDAWRSAILLKDAVVPTADAADHAGLGDGDWNSNRFVISAPAAIRAALGRAAADLRSNPLARAADLRLGPPIPDPDKILCMGLNYRDHAAEAGLDLPTVPLFFAKFRNSLIGPADQIVLPTASTKIDYEAELAVVIGSRCRNVAVEDALGHVAGAMALNDVSARDLQTQASQWTMGKAIDTFAPCGPALVLCDEISDLQALGIRTRVNGVTLQDANTSLMVFGVAEAIAFLTRVMTLEPGDIIATGTPAGVGMARQPRVWLRDGDIVEVEIDEIGTLRNAVSGSPIVPTHQASL
jgi:2-keto-4-pentenoate hydratase/2-oxohepta-3-ene-1,7-dioic acid hydratase in catechol pathway